MKIKKFAWKKLTFNSLLNNYGILFVKFRRDSTVFNTLCWTLELYIAWSLSLSLSLYIYIYIYIYICVCVCVCVYLCMCTEFILFSLSVEILSFSVKMTSCLPCHHQKMAVLSQRGFWKLVSPSRPQILFGRIRYKLISHGVNYSNLWIKSRSHGIYTCNRTLSSLSANSFVLQHDSRSLFTTCSQKNPSRNKTFLLLFFFRPSAKIIKVSIHLLLNF